MKSMNLFGGNDKSNEVLFGNSKPKEIIKPKETTNQSLSAPIQDEDGNLTFELEGKTYSLNVNSKEERERVKEEVNSNPLAQYDWFEEFEKNVDCFVLEPHVRTLEDLGWEYLEEKLTIGLTDDLRAAIDPAPFGRRALEEDRGCFTSRGYLFPTDDPWQHDRPQAKQADRKPSIRERLEQSKQECRNKNKAQAPHKGKPEPEL